MNQKIKTVGILPACRLSLAACLSWSIIILPKVTKWRLNLFNKFRRKQIDHETRL